MQEQIDHSPTDIQQPPEQLPEIVKQQAEIDPMKSRQPERQNENKLKKKRKLLSFQDEQQAQQPQMVPRVRHHTSFKKQKGKNNLGKGDNLEEQLREQYFIESARIREQLIELEFSYWDGPNVVKKIRRKKKTTIREFLQVFRLDLIQNFQSIASVQAKDLLFIIKDFIAPHEMTLGDVQLLKLRTAKRDLLLNVRSVKVKKDGKELTLSINLDGPIRIIERARFQKNKASYPFCNWHTLNLREK